MSVAGLLAGCLEGVCALPLATSQAFRGSLAELCWAPRYLLAVVISESVCAVLDRLRAQPCSPVPCVNGCKRALALCSLPTGFENLTL